MKGGLLRRPFAHFKSIEKNMGGSFNPEMDRHHSIPVAVCRLSITPFHIVNEVELWWKI